MRVRNPGILSGAIFVILFSFFNTLSAFSAPKACEWLLLHKEARELRPAPEAFQISGPEYSLKGVRYANPGGEPFILFHGLLENTRLWREVGYVLWSRGYDVYMANFRGHGDGEHRSGARRRGFKFIAGQDVEAFVEYVYKTTGKKSHIAGHSMGGMAAKLYAAGMKLKGFDFKSTIDSELAEFRARERIQTVTAIGSPSHFRNLPFALKAASHVVKPITNRLWVNFPTVVTDSKEPTAKPGITDRVKDFFLNRAEKLVPVILPDGIMKTDNMTESEVHAIRKKGISAYIPLELLDDFAYWAKTGKYVSKEGLDYGAVEQIPVPTLLIAGELDNLAPPQDVIEEGERLSKAGEVRTVHFDDTGHVDLVSGVRAGMVVGKILANHAEKPSSVISSGSRVHIQRTLADVLRQLKRAF